jgi:hypothetical protein
MSSVHVAKETVPGFVAGNGTIGTTESLLTTLSLPVHKGILVKAMAGNSGTIMVGVPGNSVNGFILEAGESTPVIPVESTDSLAIVGSAVGQAYSWFKV